MMREQRSGISEISEEDYNRDFVEKKTQSAPSSQIWREELSKSTRAIRSVDPVERLGSEYVQAAVAVAETSDIRKNSAAGLAPVTGGTPAPIGTTLSSPAPDVVSEPKKVFVPTVGKRKFGKK